MSSWDPWVVDPASGLHAQLEAAGRGTVVHGAATASPIDNPRGIEQKWTLFALQATVHF